MRPRSIVLPGQGRIASVVVVTAAALISGCSSSRMPGPSWNLTGSRDAVPVPTKPVYQSPPQAVALPPQQPAPVVTYRGGRDPVTGRAPSWGAPQQGVEQVPLAPPPAQPQPPAPAYQPTPHQPPAYQPPAVPRPKAATPAPGTRTLEVQPGQSLTSIANDNRVSIASLMAANNLRDPYVIPGQTLTIPSR